MYAEYNASDSRNEDTPNNPSLMELQREPVIHFSIIIFQENFSKLARKKQIRLIQAKHQPSIQYDYATGNVDNIVERKKAITLHSKNRFVIIT